MKGYVGDVTFLNKLADLIEELKAKNPNLVYRKHTLKIFLFYFALKKFYLFDEFL